MEFTKPSESSSGVDWQSLDGCLLLLHPTLVEKVTTAYGERDCARTEIQVLDGPRPEFLPDVRVFPAALVRTLSASLDGFVLGRLGKGKAKGSNNAPWILIDPDPEDEQRAQRWWQQGGGSLFTGGQVEQTTQQPAAVAQPQSNGGGGAASADRIAALEQQLAAARGEEPIPY